MICKWCGKELSHGEEGGDECDRCWELRSRIEAQLELAIRMIEAIQKKVKRDH